MRRFHFRLESVLKHRKVLEALRLYDFGMALEAVRESERRIEQLHADVARCLARWSRTDEIGHRLMQERFIQHVMYEAERELGVRDTANRKLELARQCLVSARQGRESVEQLREHRRREHQAEVARQEQIALDEVALLQHRCSAA